MLSMKMSLQENSNPLPPIPGKSIQSQINQEGPLWLLDGTGEGCFPPNDIILNIPHKIKHYYLTS